MNATDGTDATTDEASDRPFGWGSWGGGHRLPLPSRLGDLGERRELPQRGPAEPRPPTHSRHISAPQKPSIRRLLKF